MDGVHGGTIVPPRDGDGTTTDEDELVAQIIPLRRRERGITASKTSV
jgi:antitoxin (DNA-binding transcriptional repressor) of toxin-antitoxin stability system